MAGRLRRVVGCLGVVAASVFACESPTLPLPPPAVPSISYQGLPPGEVMFASERGAEPNALIVIYNTNPALPDDKRVGGAQADGNGTWDATIFASPGDFVEINEQSGAATSPAVTVEIPSPP